MRFEQNGRKKGKGDGGQLKTKGNDHINSILKGTLGVRNQRGQKGRRALCKGSKSSSSKVDKRNGSEGLQ